ncbi:hypothetical protein HY522_08560 [bacterium]|nr:hypothetical protein [bacterium]
MEDEDQDEIDRTEEKGKKGNRIRPRERYRALIDIIDEEQVLIAFGDRKARFALMILAAFNAAVIIGGSFVYRAVEDLPDAIRLSCLGFMFLYGITAIYFFLLAIDALRPRKAPVASSDLAAGDRGGAGLRFFLDIVKHRKEDYWEQIQAMDYDRLNRELSYQVHGLAHLITAKYDVLEHLYRGMRILTIGAAALLVAVAGSSSAIFLFQ